MKGEWENCPRDGRCEAKLCLWMQGPGGGPWGCVYRGDSPHPRPLPRVFIPALTVSVMPCASDNALQSRPLLTSSQPGLAWQLPQKESPFLTSLPRWLGLANPFLPTLNPMLAKSDQFLSNISQLCPRLEPLSPLATQGPTRSDLWKAPGWYHPLPSWKCLPSIWRMSCFWDWACLPPASPPTVLYPQEPATFNSPEFLTHTVLSPVHGVPSPG